MVLPKGSFICNPERPRHTFFYPLLCFKEPFSHGKSFYSLQLITIIIVLVSGPGI